MNRFSPRVPTSASAIPIFAPIELPGGATLSCCQQAVGDALDSSSAMGSIATLVLLMLGFVTGFAAAWLLLG